MNARVTALIPRVDRRLIVPGLAVAFAAALGAASARAPLLALGAMVLTIVAFALIARPDAATFLFTALVYSNAVVVGVQFHGLPFFVHTFLPLLLLIPLAFMVLLRRQPLHFAFGLSLIVALLAIQLAAAVVSRDPGSAAESVARYVSEGVVVFVLVTNVVRSRNVLRGVIWTLLIVGASLALLSVYQQVTGTTENEYLGFAQTRGLLGVETADGVPGAAENQERVSGPVGEPNRYAQVLLVLIPLGIFHIQAQRRRLFRLLTGMLTLVIALGVIVTFSRGAALGFTIALVVAALLRYIRARDLAVVAIAGVLLVGSLPGYVERLATVEGLSAAAAAEGGQGEADDSFRKRVNSTLAAALMFVEHPVLGVGPGQVPRHYLEYAGRVAGLPEARAFEAHNLYVGVAAESGVLGLLVFVAILLLAVRRLAAVRRRWGPNAEIGAYATGFILAIFVYMATGLFLHLAYQRYFWLLIALAAATATLGMDDDGLESRNDSGRAPQGRLPQAAVVT